MGTLEFFRAPVPSWPEVPCPKLNTFPDDLTRAIVWFLAGEERQRDTKIKTSLIKCTTSSASLLFHSHQGIPFMAHFWPIITCVLDSLPLTFHRQFARPHCPWVPKLWLGWDNSWWKSCGPTDRSCCCRKWTHLHPRAGKHKLVTTSVITLLSHSNNHHLGTLYRPRNIRVGQGTSKFYILCAQG